MRVRLTGIQREAPLIYCFECKQAGESSLDLAPTLRSMNYAGSHINGGGQLAVTEVRVPDEVMPFDPVQITHPANRSRFEPGPSPALTGDSRTPSIVGFYSTGGTHGLHGTEGSVPALKVGSSLGIPSPPAIVAYSFKPSHFTRDKDGAPSEIHPPLSADADKGDQDPVVYAVNFEHGLAPHGSLEPKPVVDQLTAGEYKGKTAVGQTLEVEGDYVTVIAPRRLTPVECARLQGFPDWWLDVDGASDSAKYRALGNAVAVPCVQWIAERIMAEDK